MPDYHMDKCDVCNKDYKCYGYVGGNSICGKCYPAYFFGVSVERKQWEEWTNSTWREMYDIHDSQDIQGSN